MFCLHYSRWPCSALFVTSGSVSSCSIFFFNDPATTEIYTLSLHDALPISRCAVSAAVSPFSTWPFGKTHRSRLPLASTRRSEEHTSELQSRQYLVCRLLLEKKNRNTEASAR